MMRPLLLAAACALFAAPAHAERFSLDYAAHAWALAPLGSARLDVTVAENDYRATTRMESGGLLAMFDKFSLAGDAQGVILGDAPDWARYDLDHTYKSKKKRRVTAMRATSEGVKVHVTPTYSEWGSPPTSEAQKREARDPLSSLIAMGLDVARTHQCVGDYKTFDGRFRYDLIMSGGARGKYEAGGYDGPVLRCRLQYKQIAGYNPKKENERRKLPQGEIWFALPEDGADFAPPVRAIVPLPLGSAGLTLKKYQRAKVDVLTEETKSE